MQNTAAFEPAAIGPSHAAAKPGRRVTDAPTRMFHWLYALSFLGAYATADGESWRALHVTLGYAMAGLLAFRVLYGLFGPRHAGLGLLWRKLGGLPPWLRSVVHSRSPGAIHWRQGQNLAMALAVVALVVSVVPLTISGWAAYEGWDGLLGGKWLEDVHEFFGESMLVVVLAHLTLIVGLSVLRRKNQALPMLTGRVEGAGPDLVRNNRAWLAGLLLLAVLAFGAWQWQQSPAGLVPGTVWSGSGASDHHRDRHRHHDDD